MFAISAVLCLALAHFSEGQDLSGRVLYRDGKPANGATVVLVESVGNEMAELRAKTLTGIDGTFHFKSLAPQRLSRAQSLVIEAPKAGLTIVSRYQLQSSSDVVLAEPTQAIVQVRDTNAQPLSGVRISLDRFFGRSFLSVPKEIRKRFSGVSDGEGFARVDGLPQGEDVLLGTQDSKFVAAISAIERLRQDPFSHLTPITVTQSGSVSGKFTLEPAKRTPPAFVRLIRSGFGRTFFTATTAKGEFRFEGLPPGRYRLCPAGDDSHPPQLFFGSIDGVTVSPGKNTQVATVKALKTGTALGRITEVGSGTPREGISVRVAVNGNTENHGVVSTLTDANGNWSMKLPPGIHQVSFAYDPFLPLKVEVGRVVRRDLTLPVWPPMSNSVKRLKVRVLDVNGRPVPFAEVYRENPGGFESDQLILADENGIATVMNPLAPTILRARKGSDATREAKVALSEDEVTLELAKNVMGSLQGKIVASGNEVAKNILITLYERSGSTGIRREIGFSPEGNRYQFDGLWPDRSYQVSSADPQWLAPVSPDISAKSGLTEGPELVITRAKRFLEGDVVDASGKPLAGADIEAEYGRVRAIADEKGHFRVGPIGTAPTMVTAYFGDFQQVSASEKSPLVLKAIPAKRTPPPAPAFAPGALAPEFQKVKAIGQAPLTLESLRGKIVVLDFWGIDCGPCLGELPSMERLWKTYRDRGVVVVGLHHSGGTEQEILKMAKDRGITYPILQDSPAQGPGFGTTHLLWRVNAIPTVMIIDREGKVLVYGTRADEAFRKVGETLAAESSTKSGN